MKQSESTETLTPESIEINKTIAQVEQALKDDKGASPALIAAVSVMLLLIKLLLSRLGLNSRNSSKPPSSDTNLEKKKRNNSNNSAGGQRGHKGSTLKPVDNPDKVTPILIDTSTLPMGNYHDAGVERRQVFDIRISRIITEYQAQILENELGQQFVAEFPPGVIRSAQYGASIKANAVYMSMFQLIPYDRVQLHFDQMFGIPISTGSLFNFNKLAYNKLEQFETVGKQQLILSKRIHADETSVNVNGGRI